jgi:glycosyltransferase involved in cell wall biosynthesis
VENLVQHISVLDICFNPLRQGGGWGVVAALEAKVPVVSLDYGDGATFLTPEGKCKDYEEAFDKICHLLEDKSAYEKIIAIQDETDKKFKNTGVHDVLRYLIDEEEKSENER